MPWRFYSSRLFALSFGATLPLVVCAGERSEMRVTSPRSVQRGTVWHFDGTRWRGTPQPTAAEPVDPDAPPLEAILLPSQRLAAVLARMGIIGDESREKALSVPGAAPRSGESSLARGR